MSWAINNLTAPDGPTAASTLDGLPALSRVNLDVYNAAIYWQLKQIKSGGAGGSWNQATWSDPVQMAPGSRPLFRPGIVGVRFWAVIPAAQLPAGGSQAQVTVEAID